MEVVLSGDSGKLGMEGVGSNKEEDDEIEEIVRKDRLVDGGLGMLDMGVGSCGFVAGTAVLCPIGDDALGVLIRAHVPPIPITGADSWIGFVLNMGSSFSYIFGKVTEPLFPEQVYTFWDLTLEQKDQFFRAWTSKVYFRGFSYYITEISSYIWLYVAPRFFYYANATASAAFGLGGDTGVLSLLFGLPTWAAYGTGAVSTYFAAEGVLFAVDLLSSRNQPEAAGKVIKKGADTLLHGYVDYLKNKRILFAFFTRFLLGKDVHTEEVGDVVKRILDVSTGSMDLKQFLIDGFVPFYGNGFLCFLVQSMMCQAGWVGFLVKLMRQVISPVRTKLEKREVGNLEKTGVMHSVMTSVGSLMKWGGLGISLVNALTLFQSLGRDEVPLDGRVVVAFSEFAGLAGSLGMFVRVLSNLQDAMSFKVAGAYQFFPKLGASFWDIFCDDQTFYLLPLRELFGYQPSAKTMEIWRSTLKGMWGTLHIAQKDKNANDEGYSVWSDRERAPETGTMYSMFLKLFLENDEILDPDKNLDPDRNADIYKLTEKVKPYFSLFYYGTKDSGIELERDAESIAIVLASGREWILSGNLSAGVFITLASLSVTCLTYMTAKKVGKAGAVTLKTALQAPEVLRAIRLDGLWWRYASLSKGILKLLNMAAAVKNRISVMMYKEVSDIDQHRFNLAEKDVESFQAMLRDTARAALRFDPVIYPNTAMQELLTKDNRDGLRKLKHMIANIPTADSALAELLKYLYVWFRDQVVRIKKLGPGERTAAAGFGFLVIWASVPVLSGVLTKDFILDLLTWLFRGFFASKSSVNFGHLQYMVWGLRGVSKVFGKVKVNNLFSKLVKMIDHTTDTGRSLLYGLGATGMFVLYGVPKDRRILKALRPEDGLDFISSRDAQKMSIISNLQNGVYDAVHPWTVLKLLWRTGPWRIAVYFMLAKLVTGNLGIARDIAMLAMSPL